MITVWTTRWRATALIAGVAALASAALTAVVGYGGASGLPLDVIAATDAGIGWTDGAESPAQLSARATDQLADWLVVIGSAAAAVGAISILALWAQQAAIRSSDLAIHRAVGASRARIIRAALGEGVGIVIGALVVGTVAAAGAASFASRHWPGGSASWHLSIVPVAAAIGGPILLGALFPLWSIRSRRVAELGDAPPPLRIPAFQLATSLTIVVAGSALLRQVDGALDRGPARLDSTFRIHSVQSPAPDLAQRAAGYAGLLRQLERPDSTAITSLTSPGGHLGAGTIDHLLTDCGQCYVGGIYLKYRQLRASYQTVSADTFDARRIRVVAGRGFSDRDGFGAPAVAVVNVYLARRYFQNGDPIGRDLFLNGRMSAPHRVIGVVDDGLPGGYGGGLRPLESLYLSSLQHPSAEAELLVQGPLPPLQSSPTLSIGPPRTAAELMAAAAAPIRWFGSWFAGEGVLVLALALIGTMSLMAIWVRGLRPELAIRRSVGARRRDVLLLVARQAVRTGLLGVGICLTFLAPALWPELTRVAPGVTAWDAGLIGRYALLLVGSALVAALVPAWRASRASPADLWSAR